MSRAAAIISKGFRRALWMVESATWPLRAPLYRVFLSGTRPLGVTIGITTYKDRFDSCLKPLLPKISLLFPKEQVIVIANGHFMKEEQLRYIDQFNRYCSRFPHIETETYTDPRGLSSLWNRIIEKGRFPGVLILNDDIMIRPRFRRLVKRLTESREPLVTINASWSHFMITEEAIRTVGLFDEGLREIGGEDDDYLARMALAGVNHGNISSAAVSGRSKRRMRISGLNSYGRDMSREAGGYSTLNTEYLINKWETSDNYFEGAVEVKGRKIKYWKLRKPGGTRA